MKISKVNLADFFGGNVRARRKVRKEQCPDTNFENPIVHKQIHGDKVYVPLNIGRVWNQVN
ncbi:hypothetical protein COJ96_02855 [Bacillus sp. AFS073361]|uniref:hypothetical protein n=1 Tax=Bacillaceae TaxID=186817 RepID=UPI000BF2E9ED|nr:hypothetical protein [Bacillus sp. AFS073361]PFP30918.1 hypothetical protein COJ96_02855 [Bacillus sp. AFS073361]